MPKIPNIAKQRLRALSSPEHPDADLLTAFTERRLKRRECDEVLGHLAECAECRELAALAASLQPDRRPGPEASRNWWSFNVVRWAGVAMVLVVGTALIANYPRFHELQISRQLSPSSASEESPVGKKGDVVAPKASPVRARPENPGQEGTASLSTPSTRSEEEAETLRRSLTRPNRQQGYSGGRLSAEQPRDKKTNAVMIDALGKNKREKAEGETAAGIGGAGAAMKPAADTMQAVPKPEIPGVGGSSTKVTVNRAPVPPPPAKAASNVNSLDQAISEVHQLKRPEGEGAQLPATPQTEAPAKGAKNQAGASSSATSVMDQPMPQPLQPTYGKLSKSDRSKAAASVASRPTSPEGSNSGTVSASPSVISPKEVVSVETKTADAGKEMSDMGVITVAGREAIPLLELAPGGPYLWSVTPAGGVQRCLARAESGARAGSCSEVALTPKAKAAAVVHFGSTVWIGTKAPAGKNSGLLFSSSDSGATFTRVLGLWTGDIVRMSLPAPESGVIFTSTKEQWTTSDGGKTWKRVVP